MPEWELGPESAERGCLGRYSAAKEQGRGLLREVVPPRGVAACGKGFCAGKAAECVGEPERSAVHSPAVMYRMPAVCWAWQEHRCPEK